MDVSTSSQNGGGSPRRRRRSSVSSSSGGESDMVVLSVVFNKKKQKQNDEVAIAIERLKENGVNCVLFTMNELRNGSRKSDSPEDLTEAFRLKAKAQLEKLDWMKKQSEVPTYSTPLPLLPPLPSAIRYDPSCDNSNSSTDSETSLSIHESVERAINSFSVSPSPSPPPSSLPLEPSLLQLSSSKQLDLDRKAPFTDFATLLKPILAADASHKLNAKDQQSTCQARDEPQLQDIQICSTSSSSPTKPAKRRKRRYRRYYSFTNKRIKPRSGVKKSPIVHVDESSNKSIVLSPVTSSPLDSISSSDEVVHQLQSIGCAPVDDTASRLQTMQDVDKSIVESTTTASGAKVQVVILPQSLDREDLPADEDSEHAAPDSSSFIVENPVRPRPKQQARKRKGKSKRIYKKSSNKNQLISSNADEIAVNHVDEITSITESRLEENTSVDSLATDAKIPAVEPQSEKLLTSEVTSDLTVVYSAVDVVSEVKSSKDSPDCVLFDSISNDNDDSATDDIKSTSETSSNPPTKTTSARKRKAKFTYRKKKKNKKDDTKLLVIRRLAATVVGFRPKATIKNDDDVEETSQSSTHSSAAGDLDSGYTSALSSSSNGASESGAYKNQPEVKVEAEASGDLSTSDIGKYLNINSNVTTKQEVESIPAAGDVTPVKASGDDDESSEVTCGDSLPATPDGMQLRRSNFYTLITENVRKNMENYVDGRAGAKVSNKRRKRVKATYLLNHGDNNPEDPEVPYRLHLATQVLLKLNKRRVKFKPKEDRAKTLLSYLKLNQKRLPRTGKPTQPQNGNDETAEEPVEEPVFSGEWSATKNYICHVCGAVEKSFWDMVVHKGEQHPGVVVTHTELQTNRIIPPGLVKNLGREDDEKSMEPTLTKSEHKCTKCRSVFTVIDEFHKHIFECAGNAFWLEPEEEVRKKKSKRRRGFKRRLSSTPSKLSPKKSKIVEDPMKKRPLEVFKCDFCSREFKTEGWLKNHVVTSHSLPVSIPLDKLSLPSRASNNSISSRLFKS